MTESTWRRSSFCADATCVEVSTRSRVRVRNPSNPDDEAVFTRDEWRAFVAGVKAGEFDLDDD